MAGDATPSCPVCFSTEMEWHGGSLLCIVCGSQSQDFAEESQEFQAGIDDNRFRRRLRTPTAKPRPRESRAEFPAAVVVELYLRCLQAGLQEQMRVLTRDMGMHPDVVSVAQRLWAACLASSGILGLDFATSLAKTADRQVAAKGKGAATLDRDGPPPAYHQPLWRVVRTAVWQVLAPDVLLSIALLSALLLREAVGPVDLVRWALSSWLPFLGLPHAAADTLVGRLPEFPLQLLQPQGVPAAHEVEANAASLAAQLGLQLPPLNVPVHLQRAALTLGMPDAAWVAAAELWALQREGGISCRLSLSATASPFTHALAPLVVALKLLYGLHGQAPSPLPPGAPPPPDWQAWAAEAFARVADPCTFPLSAEQAMALPREAAQRYVAHLRRHVLGQALPPEELRELLASLDAYSGSGGSGGGSSGPGVAAASQQQLGNAARLQPVGDGPMRSRLGSSRAAGSQVADSHTADAGEALADPHTGAASASEGPVGGADSTACDGGGGGQEDSGAAAAEDSAGNGDEASRLSATAMYISSMNVKGELAGHPDYLAVLTVVAAYGWVKPKFLHRLVVALERDVAEAEAAVAAQTP